jgi:cytoskeletal protein CcmA (bactofilin family)
MEPNVLPIAVASQSRSRMDARHDEDAVVDYAAENIRTHIAEGDEVVGELKCSAGVRISGLVNGGINCPNGTIVIDKTGRVMGPMTASGKILIDGTVGGDNSSVSISTPGLVALMNNAVVNADIQYGKLATYGDMTHNGSSRKLIS